METQDFPECRLTRKSHMATSWYDFIGIAKMSPTQVETAGFVWNDLKSRMSLYRRSIATDNESSSKLLSRANNNSCGWERPSYQQFGPCVRFGFSSRRCPISGFPKQTARDPIHPASQAVCFGLRFQPRIGYPKLSAI
ncbi:hypothetical protein B0T20DRAFT_190656 [Sordaria brevicollis]|uniref:Uncharacterized protein n=1 Tax=Sordaria brevicollis TaxID=83679 RepID=A0AAE0PFR4_SORBR|nr:hypothetical protein B0T20DRAFT_190656 [Sordaria brevicollis]